MNTLSEKPFAHQLLLAAKDGDKAAKERLVVENSGLIWSIARRFFGRGTEPEDLYQLGCIGFLKAVAGYDESFGTQFSTYSVPKISGEIRRYLRDDGIVKVSRGLKERAYAIKRARDTLEQQLGRDPRLSELEAVTNFTAEEIASAEQATEMPDSLQRENGDGGFSLENALGTDGIEDGIVESVALREAISQLPERERTLIALRFYHAMTQQNAARILGISQVQVSRLEKKAIEKLRKMIV